MQIHLENCLHETPIIIFFSTKETIFVIPTTKRTSQNQRIFGVFQINSTVIKLMVKTPKFVAAVAYFWNLQIEFNVILEINSPNEIV